jgi:hypothetical protein
MIINQQPTGNGDGVFTYQDLLLTMQQDAWTGTVYFANGSDTIICADSVLNPAIQWCAPKAETWEPPAYVAVVIPPIVCAGTCGTQTPPPIVTTTPEPAMFMFTLGIALMIIGMALKRNRKRR